MRHQIFERTLHPSGYACFSVLNTPHAPSGRVVVGPSPAPSDGRRRLKSGVQSSPSSPVRPGGSGATAGPEPHTGAPTLARFTGVRAAWRSFRRRDSLDRPLLSQIWAWSAFIPNQNSFPWVQKVFLSEQSEPSSHGVVDWPRRASAAAGSFTSPPRRRRAATRERRTTWTDEGDTARSESEPDPEEAVPDPAGIAPASLRTCTPT